MVHLSWNMQAGDARWLPASAKRTMVNGMDRFGGDHDFDFLLTSAEVALRTNRPEDARQALLKAGEQKPNSIKRLALLGAALRAMGKRKDAIDCFERILHLNPQFRAAYPSLARLLRETDHREEALAFLDGALARWPNFRQARELLRDLTARASGEPREGGGLAAGSDGDQPAMSDHGGVG